MKPAQRLDDAVEARVRRVFADELELEVDAHMDLIEGGVLDSIAFVQLLVGLEEEFGVEVDIQHLELDDFRSVAHIVQFVDGRQPEGP